MFKLKCMTCMVEPG